MECAISCSSDAPEMIILGAIVTHSLSKPANLQDYQIGKYFKPFWYLPNIIWKTEKIVFLHIWNKQNVDIDVCFVWWVTRNFKDF